jgi:hypothetical protein
MAELTVKRKTCTNISVKPVMLETDAEPAAAARKVGRKVSGHNVTVPSHVIK